MLLFKYFAMCILYCLMNIEYVDNERSYNEKSNFWAFVIGVNRLENIYAVMAFLSMKTTTVK